MKRRWHVNNDILKKWGISAKEKLTSIRISKHVTDPEVSINDLVIVKLYHGATTENIKYNIKLTIRQKLSFIIERRI